MDGAGWMMSGLVFDVGNNLEVVGVVVGVDDDRHRMDNGWTD
jgi:hypothetical protein